MKLCSRLLMVFGGNFCEKPQIWVFKPHFGKFIGVTHNLFVGRSTFLPVKWTFSAIYYIILFRSYEAKCVQLGCFHRGSTSLHSNFTWTGSSPLTIIGIKKLETLGYPVVKTASLCVPSFLTQYRSVTDGQADGYAVAYTALAARYKNGTYCVPVRYQPGRGTLGPKMGYPGKCGTVDCLYPYPKYGLNALADARSEFGVQGSILYLHNLRLANLS